MGLSLLLPFDSGPALASTSGKISGRVLDTKRQPLAGVNVTVPLARTGAATDVDGRYVIINVPAGTYDVKFSLIGYQSVTFQGVIVSADNTTQLPAYLSEPQPEALGQPEEGGDGPEARRDRRLGP